MLEKKATINLIEVIENGMVQVRTKTTIHEDGTQISGQFHRHVVVPGECGKNEDACVKAICAAVHTPEVVPAYAAAKNAA
jgi:hypothetical protein